MSLIADATLCLCLRLVKHFRKDNERRKNGPLKFDPKFVQANLFFHMCNRMEFIVLHSFFSSALKSRTSGFDNKSLYFDVCWALSTLFMTTAG